MGFGTDTKTHAYILREGETSVPESIQHAFDQAIKGQWIMRDHIRVGMTGGEALDAVVSGYGKGRLYLYTIQKQLSWLLHDGG